jgi:serine protease AprX
MSKKQVPNKEAKFVSDKEMKEIKKTLGGALGEKVAEKVIPKLDRRLAKVLAEKKTEADEKAKIKVLITLEKSVGVPADKPRAEILKAMRERTAEAQKGVLELLDSLGVEEVKQLSIVNGVVAALTPSQLQRVAEREDVKLMRLVTREKVTCLNDSVPLIHTPAVWNLGYGGHGITVAVLDTGIDGNHQALSGRVIDEVSTVAGEGVNVPGAHGTHCAGIIASNDGTYRGVSPDVNLMNVKVLNSVGGGDVDEVILGIQEAVERGADVISMSLGWSHINNGWECSDGYCILCEAVDNAVATGVVVVVAAGNENDDKSTWGGDTNIRCPGNARSVITIGGTDKNDAMYTNSSMGPTSYGLSKPAIVAPGVAIRSTVLNNQWGFKTGTSMATPHVAGLCALMLEKNPTLSCAEIKRYLEQTALDLGLDRNLQGAGRVDAEAAVRAVPPLRSRILASSGTMVGEFVEGQQARWRPAVPCWRHANWYKPVPKDIAQGVIWIWSSYWVTQEEAQKGAIKLFRKIFDLKGSGEVVSAEMNVAADNRVVLMINGDIVNEIEGFQSLTAFDVKRYLIEEEMNELKFIVINRGGHTQVWPLAVPESNPSGLIYRLNITTQR